MQQARTFINKESTESYCEQEFREYAYIVSHDLRAPVRAIVEFSRLLCSDDRETTEEERSLFRTMVLNNGSKIMAMMDGLLEFSRINTMASSKQATNLYALYEEALFLLEQEHNLSRTLIECEKLPTLPVDRGQIKKLFMILIENAIKFSEEKTTPHIKITKQEFQYHWQFCISDNGIGIPPKFQKDILKIFRQLHPEDVYGGTGVGLALADKIVRRHGGDLWFEPRSSGGTNFFFTLTKTTDEKG